jgi:hypothetical protein
MNNKRKAAGLVLISADIAAWHHQSRNHSLSNVQGPHKRASIIDESEAEEPESAPSSGDAESKSVPASRDIVSEEKADRDDANIQDSVVPVQSTRDTFSAEGGHEKNIYHGGSDEKADDLDEIVPPAPVATSSSPPSGAGQRSAHVHFNGKPHHQGSNVASSSGASASVDPSCSSSVEIAATSNAVTTQLEPAEGEDADVLTTIIPVEPVISPVERIILRKQASLTSQDSFFAAAPTADANHHPHHHDDDDEDAKNRIDGVLRVLKVDARHLHLHPHHHHIDHNNSIITALAAAKAIVNGASQNNEASAATHNDSPLPVSKKPQVYFVLRLGDWVAKSAVRGYTPASQGDTVSEAIAIAIANTTIEEDDINMTWLNLEVEFDIDDELLRTDDLHVEFWCQVL